MGDFFKPAGQWLAENVPLTVILILLLLSFFFKIPKKEVRLFSWMLAKLGNVLLLDVRKDIQELKTDNANKFEALKKDTDQRIEQLETSNNAAFEEIRVINNSNCQNMKEHLDAVEKKIDLQSASHVRAHVLNFSDDLRKGNQRTKEDYDNILEEDKEYNAIVEKYKIENNVYEHAIKFINKRYDESMADNSFATY